MRVLLKSVLILLFAAMTTETQARNNPFVGWTSVPQLKPWANTADAETMIGYLKNAAQGIVPAQGATLYADAADYREVWGEALYQQILAAPVSSFGFYQSKGGEENHGIDVDGNVVKGSVLGAGVGLIWLGKIPIAKWDTNGCLNAIGKIQTVTPAPRPNPQPNPVTPPAPTGSVTTSVQPIIINNVIPTTGNNNSNEISYRDGLKIADDAQDRIAKIERHTVELLKEAKNIGCCGNTTATATTAVATNSIPLTQLVVPTSYVQQAAPAPQQIIVQQQGPSAIGRIAEIAAGTFIGTVGSNAVNGNRTNVVYAQTPIYPNYPPPPPVYNTTPLNPYGAVLPLPQSGFVSTTPIQYNNTQLNAELGFRN